MQHVVAFLRGDDCRPCIVNACTARIYPADQVYQVLVTECSRTDGGGRTLVKGGQLDASLLPRFERKGHTHDGTHTDT